ncbi:mucin-5AC-like [Schistocerca americana]|uniref:mucin-5AC-like n=1 Tax=Schistocerca americana TaxID=7009 RepID=UPI001F4FE6B7|nr:mucin-5AC-like [Schistocerca americana]
MATEESPFGAFLEKSWTEWYEHIKDGQVSSDEEETPSRPSGDCMRLPKEDMGLFGHCPERDPFYTVVCEQCKALVKPQGLRSHMEIWHRPRPPDAPVPTPEPVEKVLANRLPSTSKTGAGNKSGAGNVKLKVKKPSQPTVSTGHPPSAAAAAAAPAPPTPAPPLGAVPVTLTLTVPVSVPVQVPVPAHAAAALANDPDLGPPVASVAPGPDTVLETIPVVIEPAKAPVRTHSPPIRQSQQKKRPRVSRDREYDPDKHCGVWNPETGRPCTRSLTCKSHSLSMRRAVAGRSQNFDRLLAEHRSAKEALGRKGKGAGASLAPSAAVRGSVQGRSPARHRSQSQNAVPSSAGNQLNTSLPIRSEGNVVLGEMRLNHVVAPSVQAIQNVVTPTPETAESILRTQSTTTSKYPLIATLARFTPTVTVKAQEDNVVAYSRKAEDGSWVTTVAPKPVAVVSLTCRKQGVVKFSSRRPDQSRNGLQTALTEGVVRVPMTSEIYSIQLNNATNHAASTMKSVLTNISTKPSLLGANTLLINSAKNHVPILPNITRKNQNSGTQNSANSFKNIFAKCVTTSAKTVGNSKPSLVKTGQFHMPNILSASLKRPTETYKSSAEAKRKRKNTTVNAVEVMTSLLGKKPAGTPTFALTTPLIKVSLPSGITANCSQPEVVNSNSVFSSQTTSAEQPKPIMTVASLPDVVKASSVKGVTQNVRIAASSSAIHVPANSIAYLTAGPVTFQKIPVLSPQEVPLRIHQQLKLYSHAENHLFPDVICAHDDNGTTICYSYLMYSLPG